MDFGGLTRTRDGVFSLTLAARAVGETPSQDPDCILHHYHRRASLSPSRRSYQRDDEDARRMLNGDGARKWIERVEFAGFDVWE